jgi:hypothetical protein
MVPSAHALRASMALKLWAIERKSHIMALVADEGLALFCGLNAMPKKSFLSEYSSRITPRKVARSERHVKPHQIGDEQEQSARPCGELARAGHEVADIGDSLCIGADAGGRQFAGAVLVAEIRQPIEAKWPDGRVAAPFSSAHGRSSDCWKCIASTSACPPATKALPSIW